jgi:HEAT repeat protein
MPEQLGDLRPYIVQVLHPLGMVEGTGFLCHPDGFVLTCWHVLESWRQINKTEGEVQFQGKPTAATWVTERSDEAADLAVLKLTKPEVREVPYLPLDVHWRVDAADSLDSFGYPEGQFAEGIGIAPKLQSLTPTKLNGLEVFPLMGFNLDDIDSGYSGAPVINAATQKVIGLVRAKHQETQAFMVPLAPLFARWPELRAFHDVFEHIRQRLGEHAQAKLAEKLRATPFIPLGLESGIPEKGDSRGDLGARSDSGENLHGRRWEALDLKRLLPPRSPFILSSDVGTGKTTFVYWLASRLVQQTRFAPLVMSCEELERLDPSKLEELLDVFSDRLANEFLPVDCHAFFAQATRKNDLVFLFDGLDQIPSGKPSALVKRGLSIAGRCPAIFSSRPSAVLGIEKDPTLTFLRLKPLSDKDQRGYFGGHYARAKAVCMLAPDLARIPMLAYMMRELINNQKINAGATRTELYAEFVRHVLIEHEPNIPLQDEPGLVKKVEKALQELAFNALAKAQPHIQRVPITAYNDEARVSLSELISFGLVNRMLDRGEETLFFTHQSFQEFLAAQYAPDKPQAIEQILAERWHPKWAEVIPFLAGLKGESIVEKILAEPDNIIHSNLFLAALCGREMKKLSVNVFGPLTARLMELAQTEPFRRRAIQAVSGLNRSLDKKQIEWLVSRLRDEDWDVRSDAVDALSSLGDRLYPQMLHEIVARLSDESENVRSTAVRALGSLGDRLYPQMLHEIVARLSDESENVRSTAVRALGSLGDRLYPEILREIVARLRDNRWEVRFVAIETLRSLGDWLDPQTLREIVALLRDEDAGVRWAAIRALGSLGDRIDPQTLREIVARLRDEGADVRAAAIGVLGAVGDRIDPQTLREIVALLRDEDAGVRWAAVRALGSLGDRIDPQMLREIVALLRDENAGVRLGAVEALGSLGDRIDSEMMREIVALFRDEDAGVRRVAVGALGSLGDRLDSEMLREFVARLRDENAGVRWAAVGALGSLDRIDPQTLREIVARLRDEDAGVRSAAVGALGSLGVRLDSEMLREFVARLRDENVGVRSAAVRALGLLGDWLDPQTLREIVARLPDESENVRWAAVAALGSLGDRIDSEMMSEIVARLHDENPEVRRHSIEALGSLGNRIDPQMLREIVALFRDENAGVRRAAVGALGSLGNRIDSEMLREFVARLRDENAGVRRAAVGALGSLGDRIDSEKLREIAARLRDESENVRNTAYSAFARLYRSGVRLPSR